MNNTPILLTDRITRTRYKRVYKMAQGGWIHGIVSMAVSRFHLRRDESAIPQTSAECLRLWLCDRRGHLRSIVGPQPITHWSEHWLASWGLAGLILASLVVFGALGCESDHDGLIIHASNGTLTYSGDYHICTFVTADGTRYDWPVNPIHGCDIRDIPALEPNAN